MTSEDPLSSLRVVFMGTSLLAMGTLGFYHLPGMIAPDAPGSREINAFYCATVTLTTCVEMCCVDDHDDFMLCARRLSHDTVFSNDSFVQQGGVSTSGSYIHVLYSRCNGSHMPLSNVGVFYTCT